MIRNFIINIGEDGYEERYSLISTENNHENLKECIDSFIISQHPAYTPVLVGWLEGGKTAYFILYLIDEKGVPYESKELNVIIPESGNISDLIDAVAKKYKIPTEKISFLRINNFHYKNPTPISYVDNLEFTSDRTWSL